MKRMQKINRCISGLLAGVMTTSLISMLPAKADESELYPYTMFTGSDKDESITINAVQGGCINGNIATNGTINSSQNINFNGRKQEIADKEIIKINQKLRDRYFSSEDVYHFLGDYEIAEINVNLNNPLEVQGNINLSGNVNSNTEIFALENIQLNGESLNANNSVIYSQLGNVDIDFSNVNFSGLIYAPNGDVEISGQWLNLNNVVIIADTIKFDGQYINMNYSREFAEVVGLESENNDSSSEADSNSSLIESSQIEESSSEYESSVTADSSNLEENSSLNDSSETDNTSSNENSSVTESSSMIDSSKADESSSVNDSSSIDDSSKPDDSSSEDTDMLDDDNDGLVNAYEKAIGTDKDKPDTDNDGLTDYQEIYFTGTDPLKFDSVTDGISDAEADSDEDGLSNVKEIEIGTNPQISDTDCDGLSDGDEINIYGTDPLNPDTDNDGISDGEEVKLGLDPKNGSSDGKTLDSERTFSQHIDVNSEIFSEINIEQNPFKVSMDITAAGSAENNLNVFESGYTNVISSDMVLGVAPEFTYTDGLNVEDVVINFDLDDDVTENTNGKYADILDEFKGIKRYNVFKYFEDTNMLLPIETFFDEENNRVYTHVDELGTYCLIDMEDWFENLGVEPSKFVQNKPTRALKMKAAPETPLEQSISEIDVVFNVFCTNSQKEDVKENIILTCERLFNEYGSNGQIHIYVASYMGDCLSISGKSTCYASNMEELENMLENLPGCSENLTPELYDSVNNFLENNNLCKKADKFYFIIAPKIISLKYLNSMTSRMKDKNIIVCSAYNFPDLSSITSETGGEWIRKSLKFGDEAAKFIIKKHGLGKHEDEKPNENNYKIISATGWQEIKLDAPITSDYKEIAGKIEQGQSVDRTKYADTDKDGLLDLEEIAYKLDDNVNLIDWDENGEVILPRFEDCVHRGSAFYVEDGLARYFENGEENVTNLNYLFGDVRILPIESDPTKEDSDNDNLNDKTEKELKTSSLSNDTDKDGLTDYLEVVIWFDPCNPNPDGDTYDDLQEYQNDTSPYVYDFTNIGCLIEFKKGLNLNNNTKVDNIPVLLGKVFHEFTFLDIIDKDDDFKKIFTNIKNKEWNDLKESAILLIPASCPLGSESKFNTIIYKYFDENFNNAPLLINSVNTISEYINVFEYLPKESIDKFKQSLQNADTSKISKSEYEKLKAVIETNGENIEDYLSIREILHDSNNNIKYHPAPKFIKRININDENTITDEIAKFEKDNVDKEIEMACVITNIGEVFYCFGVADEVYINFDLGDKIIGSIVTHNHPIEETIFSFSNNDVDLFEEYQLKILRGFDKKFTYELNRVTDDIDSEPLNWDTIENFQHTNIIYIAEERGYGYRRWENGKEKS